MKSVTFRIIQTVVATFIIIILSLLMMTGTTGRTRNLRSCRLHMEDIIYGLNRYFDEHKQYPPKLQDIYNYIVKKHEYIPPMYQIDVFRCPSSKNKQNVDYDYFIDSAFRNIILYEKWNHHYIGGGGCLHPYNARHVLISDGKNKDIKLYTDTDFKALLDKYQHKSDKKNK